MHGFTSGSGFVFNRDHDVLTPLHAVGDEKTVEILPNAFGPDNSISLPYRVHRTFEGLDTAWLKKLAYLGQAVLDEAKANPAAPELPELLYKMVKLPLWSGDSKSGSRYSKRALLVLKERYPLDKWAKKVRYSY